MSFISLDSSGWQVRAAIIQFVDNSCSSKNEGDADGAYQSSLLAPKINWFPQQRPSSDSKTNVILIIPSRMATNGTCRNLVYSEIIGNFCRVHVDVTYALGTQLSFGTGPTEANQISARCRSARQCCDPSTSGGIPVR